MCAALTGVAQGKQVKHLLQENNVKILRYTFLRHDQATIYCAGVPSFSGELMRGIARCPSVGLFSFYSCFPKLIDFLNTLSGIPDAGSFR
jgi:hypothetical protein